MMFLLIAGGLDQMVPSEAPSDLNYSLKMQVCMLLVLLLKQGLSTLIYNLPKLYDLYKLRYQN